MFNHKLAMRIPAGLTFRINALHTVPVSTNRLAVTTLITLQNPLLHHQLLLHQDLQQHRDDVRLLLNHW